MGLLFPLPLGRFIVPMVISKLSFMVGDAFGDTSEGELTP